MHLPIEFSICSGVSHNGIVESLDSVSTTLVIFDSGVNLINKGEEVVLVLLSNLFVFGVRLIEPGNDFVLVEIECESVVLDVLPG